MRIHHEYDSYNENRKFINASGDLNRHMLTYGLMAIITSHCHSRSLKYACYHKMHSSGGRVVLLMNILTTKICMSYVFDCCDFRLLRFYVLWIIASQCNQRNNKNTDWERHAEIKFAICMYLLKIRKGQLQCVGNKAFFWGFVCFCSYFLIFFLYFFLGGGGIFLKKSFILHAFDNMVDKYVTRLYKNGTTPRRLEVAQHQGNPRVSVLIPRKAEHLHAGLNIL